MQSSHEVRAMLLALPTLLSDVALDEVVASAADGAGSAEERDAVRVLCEGHLERGLRGEGEGRGGKAAFEAAATCLCEALGLSS